MTGPEHYRAAQELLSVASEYERDGASQTAMARIVEAQVHATLAMAAAYAMPHDRAWTWTAGPRPSLEDE